MKKFVPHNEVDLARAKASFMPRVPLLKELAHRLQDTTSSALHGVPHVDRVSFRAKDADSFAKKCFAADKDGKTKKYTYPLEELEDQIGGRVLVFFRSDIDVVVNRLVGAVFNEVEDDFREPSDVSSFDYESHHLVLHIPITVLPTGWSEIEGMPSTFEMQIRTLAMHAYAEPQHDIVYKPDVELTRDERRQVALAAANAWGIDTTYEQVRQSVAIRSAADKNQPET
jgi:putative GTP pyrophosphokinase